MSASEIIALIVGVGGLITAIITARNSAKQADVDMLTKRSEVERLETDDRNRAIDNEFNRLHGEIKRMDEALERRRNEIERLFGVETELRRALAMRDEEMATLRRDLSNERALNTNLVQRTTELEKRVRQLTAQREVLIKALRDANIDIPEFNGKEE